MFLEQMRKPSAYDLRISTCGNGLFLDNGLEKMQQEALTV